MMASFTPPMAYPKVRPIKGAPSAPKAKTPPTFKRPMWNNYVCPAWQVREEILRHRNILQVEALESLDDPGNAPKDLADDLWRVYLARRMTNYGGESTTWQRWLYRVLKGESVAADANRVDICLLSIGGILIDHTGVETFPGNPSLARETVLVRAEFLGEELDEPEIRSRIEALLDERDEAIYRFGRPDAARRLAAKAKETRSAKKTPLERAVAA